MTMTNPALSLESMVPISSFSRGGASSAFSKVKNAKPVVVLKNSEPAYMILTAGDFQELIEANTAYESMRARYEAETGEGKVFDNVDDLMEDLND